RPVFRHQLDGDPDGGQVAGDGLGGRLRSRVVGAADRHVPELRSEAVGVTGFGQKLTGAFRIVVVGPRIALAGHGGRDEGIRRDAEAAVERFDYRFAIDSVSDGLAYQEVIEGLVGLMHGDVTDVQFAGRDGRDEVGIVLDGLKVVDRQQHGDVDGARLQFGQARSRLGDAAEHYLLDLGRSVPVVVVAFEDDAFAFDPLDELERTSADGAHTRGAVGHAGGFDGGRAAELEVHGRPQRRQERRRLGQVELDLVVGEDRGFGDEVALTEGSAEHPTPRYEGLAFGAVANSTGGIVPAVDVELDSFGVERRAVVEADAFTEGEDPLGGVFVGRPLGGQAGDQIGSAGGEVDEALGDLSADDQRVTVLRIYCVHGRGEAADAVYQRLRAYGAQQQQGR